jgi:anti-sigma regulatory factor (Ser/Thr protein kinase)
LTAVQHQPAQIGSGVGARAGQAGPSGQAFPEPRPQAPGRPATGPRSGAAPGRRASGSTVGRRVARILALPAVVILLLLSLLSAQQIQDYRHASATSDAVTLSLEVQKLVSGLQTERGVTAAVQGGNGSFTPELAPARTQVDAQRRVVQSLVDDGDAAQAKVGDALSQLDGLSAIRATTDGTGTGKQAETAERTATFAYYTQRIRALADVDLGLGNSSDTDLRQGLTAFRSMQHAIEGLSQERAFLNGVYSAGGFTGDEFVRLADMRAEYQYSLDQFGEYATTDQRASLAFIFSTGAAQVVQSFEKTALAAGDGRHLTVNPQSWWSGMGTLLADANQLEQHVGSQIQLRAHDLRQEAAQRIGVLLIAVLVCFAGSIYLSTLAAQSITRPLAALAAEADDLAVRRLPEAVRRAQAADPDAPPRRPDPVAVPSRATDEIRSVATALDHLQSAAYDLATEQAVQRRDTIESLANLGRRNQNLIRRQLGFITSLEREEVDPNALANLFELDHLATRMRRNAASLLVLVDASSPRTWSQAVPVSDVIRAAVSEVEEYRRVALRRVDDANVLGGAIGSIAHLLSELIENGLTFSPPDSEVEVQGRRISDGYLIAITDQGVGMNPEELRIANSRLRGEGDFIAAPTRFLGHFVVGKLARDSGVHVELLPSPVTGVTARVILPATLLSASLSVRVQSLESLPEGPVNQVRPAQLLALPRMDRADRLDRLDEFDDGLVPLDRLDQVPDDPRDLYLGTPGVNGANGVPRGPWSGRGAPEPGTLPGGLGPLDDLQEIHDAQVRDVTPPNGPADPPVIEPVIEEDDQDRPGYRTPAHRVETDPAGLKVSEGNPIEDEGSDDRGGPADPEAPDSITGTPRWAKPGDLFARQFGARSPEEQAAREEARRRRDAPDSFTDLRTPAAGVPAPAAVSTRPSVSLPTPPAGLTIPGVPRSEAVHAPALSPAATRRPAAGATEHTQNGLRKRVPRGQRQSEPARSARRVIDLDAAAARPRPVGADSPADVSARLTALRAGMRRGQAGQAPAGSNPEETVGMNEE